MKKDVLCRPFSPDQIKQRPGQNGKTLSYIETHAVIARLNEACESWDFTIERYELLDEEVVVLGRLVVEGAVTKTAFGGSTITRDREGRAVSVADDLKAAGSDALKKAASLLGVGLELYGARDDREVAKPPVAPPPRDERLTQRQLAAIYSSARRRSVTRQQLGDLLRSRTGKLTPEELSRREASQIISELTEANGHART